MTSAPLPSDELARLDALYAYDILDTPPEEAFDRITRLASRLLEVPIALVNLIDAGRHWGKSAVGLPTGEVSRRFSPCAHAILETDLTVVPDARQDARFYDNPFVVGEPHMRFYAAAPLITPSGQAVGTLCILHQDEYAWSAERAGLLRDLASMVMDALELRRKRAEAERRAAGLEHSVRLKAEFFASMNHELRTPLSAILGLSELLLEGVGGPLGMDHRDYVQTIRASGEHLLALVQDALDVSKLEAGQMRLHPESLPLERVLEDSAALVRGQAEKKGVPVRLEPVSPGLCLWADRTKLRQILVNLLSNAVKFSREGSEVVLRARVRGGLSNGPEVALEVQDSGVGLRPEQLERLFAAYAQVDDSLERRHLGTGLGLALVRHLSELHGGRVEVESEYGVGSVFTVWLPLEQGRSEGEVLEGRRVRR